MGKTVKLRTTAILLILFISSMIFPMQTAMSSGSNALQNPGFESATAWNVSYSSFLGSYAAVQDSAYSHNGTCSSLTLTSNPLQEFCSASVYQTLNVPVLSVGTLSYWIRKGPSAPQGYYTGKVQVSLSGGYTLNYYHGFDGSAPPSDTGTVKYINAGNPPSSNWTQISRNLYSDLTTKFGSSVFSRNVTKISFMSLGYRDAEDYSKHGQRINWDDVFLEQGVQHTFTVTLTSCTRGENPNQTNVGTITFDGLNYSLPNSVEKNEYTYSVVANPPEGYYFCRWETTGSISVSNTTSQSSTATVNGNSTLKAIFVPRLWTIMVYMCGDRNWLDYGSRISINEMETVGSTEDVSVLTFFDASDGEDVPPWHPDWPSGCGFANCYNITKDNHTDKIFSPSLYSREETNASDPVELVNFVNWCIANFTAVHYALILDDHGYGWKGIISDGKLTADQQKANPIDTMSLAELRWALDSIKNDTGVTVDVLAFDACRMAQVEVCYYLRDLVQICAASEEVILWDACFAYHYILGNLTANPEMSAQELADNIVVSFRDWYAEHPTPDTYDTNCTMSSMDVSKIADLAHSIDCLADHILANLSDLRSDVNYTRQSVHSFGLENDDFVDLYHFASLLENQTSDGILKTLCQAVRQNVSSLILKEWHGVDAEGSYGISIYFPRQSSEYDEDYMNISMSEDFLWDDFLTEYFS